MSTKTTISEKVAKIIGELDASFVERKKAVRLSLLAMLSGEHVVLLGPPGTAKSLLVRTICEAIQGGQYFDYLLTRFTTPDEIFGPLSIKKLEQDVYERQTDSYLPTAHIAFLDEIFKANSSILNSLLTLINERYFHNGSQLMEVPLISIFGASNETPEDETLSALYDRFLVRVLVKFVEEDESFSSIVFGKAGSIPIKTKLSIKELESLSKSAQKVKVPKSVQEMILVLKRDLAEIGVVLSDRRWKQLIGFLKTMAAASNRRNVQETDLLILQEMLWDEPSQISGIRDTVWNAVVAAEHDAETLRDDVEQTKAALEKAHLKKVKVKDNYGYDTRKTKKKKVSLSKVNFNMYMKQIRELEKSLKSGRKKVGDRRKKYEQQLKGNIWIQTAGLIEDVEKELTELAKVDESLVTLRSSIENWPKEDANGNEEEEDDKEQRRRRARR
ncbi:MAG: AAA family ATPase [Candidatus Thorarchaeota archaeon]